MNSDALMLLLRRAFAGAFLPRQRDGLASLSVNGGYRGKGSQYGPMIPGLSGVDLVRAWAAMDRNPRGDEVAGRYPGSQYASWWNGQMGNSTGYQRASRASHALGGSLGGGLGQMSNQDYLRFMGGLL